MNLKAYENIQAVTFDLYNTLIYLADETKPYIRLFKSMGLQNTNEWKHASKIALTETFDTLESFVKRIKPDIQINVESYQQELEKEKSSARLYPETIKVLNKLKGEGNLKLGLISNLSSPYTKPFFKLGLNEYFDEILFSCNVGLKKPDPKIYQQMVTNLNLNPTQILMVGDNVSADVKGPRSIGMNAIHLDRRGCASSNSINNLEDIFQYILYSEMSILQP